jgi:NAD-dependent deacetylase
MDLHLVERVAAWLREADSALFITGAGVSAESGLPTYRGVGGLYEDVAVDEGLPIEVVLSGQMMVANPALCWKYITQIEANCRGAQFNRAHTIIAALEERIDRVVVLTQNVDGFHLDAGSTRVIEIHGNLRKLLCTKCTWRMEVEGYAGLGHPPTCPSCGGSVRPDVVLFGEWLPQGAVAALGTELSRGFDLVLSVGTTSLFPYIAEPVVRAARAGLPTVEINPGKSEVSNLVDVRLRERAVAALEAVWEALGGNAP